MVRTGAILTVGVMLVVLSAHAGSGQGAAGPQSEEEGVSGGQAWLIPSPDPAVLMHATVFRPRGSGPFGLVVINHGSVQNELRRIWAELPAFEPMATWFRERGYVVVVPERPGHGQTGGTYLEDQEGCENANYLGAGMGTAASIATTIDYMTAQAFVRRTGAVVVGQSAGGFGALALASRYPSMVRAVINFAGGRGGHADGEPGRVCAADRLVAAVGQFGRTSHAPTLWLYAQNDSYFPPALAVRMADAYRSAGGEVELHLLPPFGQDGHVLMESGDAVGIWGPLVAAFLSRHR